MIRFNFLQSPERVDRLRALLPGGGNNNLKTASTAPIVRRPARRGSHGGTQLAIKQVRGNLTITARTVTVWFTLAEQPWAFGSDTERDRHIYDAATQLAALAGRTVLVRRTNVPFPIQQWAANLTANSRPLPDPIPADLHHGVERAVTIDAGWRAHLGNATQQLAGREHTLDRAHLGVVLPRPRKSGDDLRPLAVDIAHISETVAQPGLSARPATSAELLWLLYRSAGVGLNPPAFQAGDIGPDDIDELTEAIDWRRGRFDSTTQLIDRRTGESVHVAVLTVGRMGELEIPQRHEPWAHLSGQLDFPVEWSSRIQLLGPDAVRNSVQLRQRIILSQIRDYGEHRLPEPPDLERRAAHATQIGDELATGLPVDASRAHGWHRLAVYGATTEECLARARDLTRIYNDMLHIQLVHPRNQVSLLREFIPGEPDANTGHIRRLPVTMMAAAVPQATSKVGDEHGDLIGHTVVGGTRPVFLDLHYPMEVRERGGLVVLVGEPGGGKSTLVGGLGYLNARRGVRVTLMDPSGPLARLCSMPELAPYSRVINLTGSEQGTLAPYPTVPTPRRRDFERGPQGDAKYDDAVTMAHHERRGLVYDICRMLLPVNIPNYDAVAMAIREAIAQVPAQETATLNDVIATLRERGAGDPSARIAAGLLSEMAGLPQGRLFFGSPPPGTLDDAPLTVITMAGISLPDMSIERGEWTTDEALAVPTLHMANRLAARRCYAGDMHSRKMVGLDEAHLMAGWKSGKAFFNRLARDSRKWNIAALVASQNPADILDLDVQNLVTSVFVARIAEDAQIGAQALRLLHLPQGDGYEAVLAGLSQYDTTSDTRLGYREFAIRDVDGRVQIVRVDLSYVPGLLAALNTTPGSRKAAR